MVNRFAGMKEATRYSMVSVGLEQSFIPHSMVIDIGWPRLVLCMYGPCIVADSMHERGRGRVREG